MACHTTGAGGAPVLGDVAAWADRIAKGTDVLYASGINGVPGTGMIAKGGCMACSDEEINAAVDFMIAGSQ
jgi:cytochrome c5